MKKVCSHCINWDEGKCSKCSGYYPEDSPLAENCKHFESRTIKQKVGDVKKKIKKKFGRDKG